MRRRGRRARHDGAVPGQPGADAGHRRAWRTAPKSASGQGAGRRGEAPADGCPLNRRPSSNAATGLQSPGDPSRPGYAISCGVSRVSSSMTCPCRRWMRSRQEPQLATHRSPGDQSNRCRIECRPRRDADRQCDAERQARSGRTRADPPFCTGTIPSVRSARGAQNGIFCCVGHLLANARRSSAAQNCSAWCTTK